MGYTHYWTQKSSFTDEQWAQLISEIEALFTAAGKRQIRLANGFGDIDSMPEINADRIWFNGVQPKEDHETMGIERVIDGDGWSFCKTAYKPYDVVVVAAPVLLESVYGYAVTSDGDAEDWADGIALAREVWPQHRLELPASLSEGRSGS